VSQPGGRSMGPIPVSESLFCSDVRNLMVCSRFSLELGTHQGE
jgi:hypothetical protein